MATQDRNLAWVCHLPLLIQAFVDGKALVMMSQWPEYVSRQIGRDIQFLQDVLNKTVLCQTKQHISAVYTAEHRIIAFMEGMTTRYDYKHLKSLAIPAPGIIIIIISIIILL